MLGENDFKRELGKGICIYPFHESNLKENSYNLTIGQNAWSMGSGKITRRGEGKFTEATSNERMDHQRIEDLCSSCGWVVLKEEARNTCRC
jgi:hypothetical protein